MRPRMPMRGRGSAGLGSAYGRQLLAARAQRQMLLEAGDALREREALLSGASYDPYGLGSDLDFSADVALGAYGGGFALDGYHAY